MNEIELLEEKIKLNESLMELYFSTDEQYEALLEENNNLRKQINSILNEEPSEELFEMATIYPKNRSNHSIVLAVNPDSNKIGSPYFKLYIGGSPKEGKATGVASIEFLHPKLIKNHKGNIPSILLLNSSEKKELVQYLTEFSQYFPKYTVWNTLKYFWNVEYGFDVGSIDDYMSGKFDDIYNISEKSASYLCSTITSPDYTLM